MTPDYAHPSLLRKIKCYLGFHAWESIGKVSSLYGHNIDELFTCFYCMAHKKEWREKVIKR